METSIFHHKQPNIPPKNTHFTWKSGPPGSRKTDEIWWNPGPSGQPQSRQVPLLTFDLYTSASFPSRHGGTRWCPPSYKWVMLSHEYYRYNPLINPSYNTYKPSLLTTWGTTLYPQSSPLSNDGIFPFTKTIQRSPMTSWKPPNSPMVKVHTFFSGCCQKSRINLQQIQV